jgi:hypothetical protein
MGGGAGVHVGAGGAGAGAGVHVGAGVALHTVTHRQPPIGVQIDSSWQRVCPKAPVKASAEIRMYFI